MGQVRERIVYAKDVRRTGLCGFRKRGCRAGLSIATIALKSAGVTAVAEGSHGPSFIPWPSLRTQTSGSSREVVGFLAPEAGKSLYQFIPMTGKRAGAGPCVRIDIQRYPDSRLTWSSSSTGFSYVRSFRIGEVTIELPVRPVEAGQDVALGEKFFSSTQKVDVPVKTEHRIRFPALRPFPHMTVKNNVCMGFPNKMNENTG
jgi:hypothetical protein